LPIADAAMIWPEGVASPADVAHHKELEAKKPKWSLTLEMGADATEGNSDTLNARGRVQAQRKGEKDLFQLYLSGDYGEQNDIRSTAEAKAGAYYEYSFTERFFAYGRTEAEYDEFENLALRLTVAAGPGYYWIKKPNHELKTRAGLGYQHEKYLDENTTDKAIMDIGLDYRLDITEWLQFTNSTVYYPTFEELRDYRLTSDFAIIMPIASSEIWKFKIGALFEYDPIPNPGFEELDQTYYASIVMDLK
jgi:putative salt-induced outer membrane protein YdiY